MLHQELSNKIIKAFYKVYNELGFGFLENVYQNALYLELKSQNLAVAAQKSNRSFLSKHTCWTL